MWDDRVYALEPYVREANLWLAHFDEARIVAPVVEKQPEKHEVTYARSDIDFKMVPMLGGNTLLSKLISIINLPIVLQKIWRNIRGFNHLHIRLPGNIGFFTLLLCPLLKLQKTVKYAGQWDDFPSQPLSVKIQKRLVSWPWWLRNGQVLVYGRWDKMSKHLLSFFTASYWQNEIEGAGSCAAGKRLVPSEQIRIAFVARLTANKGGDIALRAINVLSARGIDVELDVVGDGPELESHKHLANDLGIAARVKFHGNQPKGVVAGIFGRAHFVLCLSQTEGWPKVVAEGMVWGAVPVVTPISCLPWMLDGGRRGKLVMRDPEEVASAIAEYVLNPASYEAAASRSHEWARQFTMEAFDRAIAGLV